MTLMQDSPYITVLCAPRIPLGSVKKDGEKVKPGCFCNLRATKKATTKDHIVVVPIEEPKVILLFRVGKETVEHPEDTAIPMNVKVAKMADKQIRDRDNRKLKK